jgi:ornithine--oxo-acid transaminase
MLCSDWDDVKPDMVCLGKALSGGFMPVSALLGSDQIFD